MLFRSQDIKNQSEERATKMAAFNKEQGPAFAGYEKLLKAEELQDATDKEKSGLMAKHSQVAAMTCMVPIRGWMAACTGAKEPSPNSSISCPMVTC